MHLFCFSSFLSNLMSYFLCCSIIYPLQINPEKAREEFRTASQKSGGTGVKDIMDSMGLGMLVEQVDHIYLVDFIYPWYCRRANGR